VKEAEAGLTRREAIASLALAALAASGCGAPSLRRFRERRAAGETAARFFAADELETLRLLADMILPRDERSGSASEAGAVEYIDFVVGEAEAAAQQAARDGLRWFDEECQRRFQRPFAGCDEAQRSELLGAIAWPARARSELRPAVEFFSHLRDLTAAAFFSSRLGILDLGYQGGVAVSEWRGAPEAALRELGVSYDEWDRRYGAAAPPSEEPAARGARGSKAGSLASAGSKAPAIRSQGTSL